MKNLPLLILIITLGCFAQQKTTGKLVADDDAFYNYVDKDAKIEVLAEGFIFLMFLKTPFLNGKMMRGFLNF